MEINKRYKVEFEFVVDDELCEITPQQMLEKDDEDGENELGFRIENVKVEDE
mgnify:CR=1 FL=1